MVDSSWDGSEGGCGDNNVNQMSASIVILQTVSVVVLCC